MIGGLTAPGGLPCFARPGNPFSRGQLLPTFQLALLNWMPLDKYWLKKKKSGIKPLTGIEFGHQIRRLNNYWTTFAWRRLRVIKMTIASHSTNRHYTSFSAIFCLLAWRAFNNIIPEERERGRRNSPRETSPAGEEREKRLFNVRRLGKFKDP